jgi:putative ABC transport system ATP-binding protein
MTLMPTSVDRFYFSLAQSRDVDLWETWQAGKLDVLADLRRRFLGYVLQTGGLLPYLSVRANIDLPRRLLGLADDGTVDRLADSLGISAQLAKRPSELSVGERQRVAVARALAHKPRLIIADEPTASVDPLAATAIMRLLVELADRSAASVIVATHDWERLQPLGFRRLHHGLHAGTGHGVTIATFSD